ncbi:hypothetical protein Tco_1158349, partial [Tanacetum coccineum]
MLFSAAASSSFNTSSIKDTKQYHLDIKSSSTRCNAKKTTSGDGDDDVSRRGSGTTARGRRLLKVREEKQKREFDRLNNYPSWA